MLWKFLLIGVTSFAASKPLLEELYITTTDTTYINKETDLNSDDTFKTAGMSKEVFLSANAQSKRTPLPRSFQYEDIAASEMEDTILKASIYSELEESMTTPLPRSTHYEEVSTNNTDETILDASSYSEVMVGSFSKDAPEDILLPTITHSITTPLPLQQNEEIGTTEMENIPLISSKSKAKEDSLSKDASNEPIADTISPSPPEQCNFKHLSFKTDILCKVKKVHDDFDTEICSFCCHQIWCEMNEQCIEIDPIGCSDL